MAVGSASEQPEAPRTGSVEAVPAGSVAAATQGAEAGTPRRTRVVLAEVAQRQDRADRTRVELAEQTRVGEALVRGLVRAQLALALRLAVVVAVGLGALPLLFAVAPAVGTATLFRVNLPWLLLGFAAFPFLFAVGWAYVHLAERNEQDFTDLVRRPER